MSPDVKLDILKLIDGFRSMRTSPIACQCGKQYRLMLDLPTETLLDKIEAAVLDQENIGAA